MSAILHDAASGAQKGVTGLHGGVRDMWCDSMHRSVLGSDGSR